MASWVHRLFNRAYRRALAAEAAADYTAAAEAYALAGMPAKVAEMHLVRAGRAEETRRIDALEDALRWMDKVEAEEAPEGLGDKLAAALVAEAKALPEGDPRRPRLAGSAAALYEKAGSLREAGEAFELVGTTSEAARCYEAAGAIEAMERLLDADAGAEVAGRRARDGFDEFETAMACGARDAARAALRRCVAAQPGKGYEKLLADLESRLPRPGSVELLLDGRRLAVVGRAPAVIGRGDADLRLRHPGISRRHAAIDVDGDGFALRDAGSRNGTTFSGITVSGRVRLVGSGTIGLGDQCELEFAVRDPSTVELEVHEGPDRGLRVAVVTAPYRPSQALPFVLAFRDDLATVSDGDGEGLVLNGARVSGPVVLLVGDVVEGPAGGRLEVSG